jgi:hypothetical protein
MTPRAHRASIVALQLVALAGFAVAQPLYDILAQNAEFFVAHQVRPGDLVLLALALSALIPLVLITCAWLGGAPFGGLTPGSAAPLVGALSALLALPILNRLTWLPAMAAIGLALGLGILVGWASWRRAGVRVFLAALSPAAVVFPLWFLFATPVSTLMRPGSIADQEVPATAGQAIDATTPVVIVVFDEFPLASLVDESDGIEPRFGGFARLAATSYWFRNATTVFANTTASVPALLSGRAPLEELLPTAADHPDNLFRLLASGGYGLRVFESHTSLCDDPACADGEPRGSRRERLASLVPDVAIIYPHLILPERFARLLPAIDAGWRDFAHAHRNPTAESNAVGREVNSPVTAFERLLAAIASGERSTLYFAHVYLPHMPWQYFPSGREYGPMNMAVVPHGLAGRVWVDDDWQVLQSYQRHLLQVGLADGLVGRLLDGLEGAGLFDEAMIVVVADHGISFLPGEEHRLVSAATLGDIVNVPVFVKLPGQRVGEVSDRNVETIDLLPTIAEVLAIDLPWTVDGVSMLAPAAERPFKTVWSPGHSGPAESRQFSLQSLVAARARTAARKVSLFGGAAGWDGLFAIGPRNADAAGRVVADLVGVGSEAALGLEVELDQPEQWTAVDPAGPYVPAQVTGRLVGPAARAKLPLAIAVDGVVRATTWSYSAATGGVRFSAMLPEDSFRPGANEIEVLLLDAASDPLVATAFRQASRLSYRLVATPEGTALEAGDGRRLAVTAGAGRARARIRSFQRGASLRGAVRVAPGHPNPDTLVATLGGEPLFATPFSRLLVKDDAEHPANLVRFEVGLPQSVVREAGELRVFVVTGDRVEAVRLD